MLGAHDERSVVIAHFPNGQWMTRLELFEEAALEWAELAQFEFGAEVWVQLCIAGEGEEWSAEP